MDLKSVRVNARTAANMYQALDKRTAYERNLRCNVSNVYSVIQRNARGGADSVTYEVSSVEARGGVQNPELTAREMKVMLEEDGYHVTLRDGHFLTILWGKAAKEARKPPPKVPAPKVSSAPKRTVKASSKKKA